MACIASERWLAERKARLVCRVGLPRFLKSLAQSPLVNAKPSTEPGLSDSQNHNATMAVSSRTMDAEDVAVRPNA